MPLRTSDGAKIAYFVHDVADAAVLRRVRMFHAAGAVVRVVGFRRRPDVLAEIDGAPVVDLGMTGDGRFAQRIYAVLRTLLAFGAVRAAVADADVLVARNLETLVLAARAARSRRLVYECLDVHRTLLTNGTLPKIVQRVEASVLAKVDLIVTSSPRFADDYFRKRRNVGVPIIVIENKIEEAVSERIARSLPRKSGPPWVIGWFGMLRCRRSLELLARLAAGSDGAIEVLVAGIPSAAEFADFAGTVATMPGVTFIGRYSPEDLALLYGRTHFAWAIDYFEEGLNSAWLLPNRLYEALAYGSVPIALSDVETGAWLSRQRVGLPIEDPAAIGPMLAALDASAYRRITDQIAAIPRAAIEMMQDEIEANVATIVGSAG